MDNSAGAVSVGTRGLMLVVVAAAAIAAPLLALCTARLERGTVLIVLVLASTTPMAR